MGILAWLVVGLIAGWLTGELMRGEGYGVIWDIVIGIVGALLGGFLASAIFGVADPLTGFDITTLIVALVGSIILVAIVRAVTARA
jgi:uncharacterized membrane protein YeaQ/YmgE (transglycosylase-associated protein family)